MEKEEIDDIVCQIMINDGPDRHIDGHELITGFILAVQQGRGAEWAIDYGAGKIKRNFF